MEDKKQSIRKIVKNLAAITLGMSILCSTYSNCKNKINSMKEAKKEIRTEIVEEKFVEEKFYDKFYDKPEKKYVEYVKKAWDIEKTAKFYKDFLGKNYIEKSLESLDVNKDGIEKKVYETKILIKNKKYDDALKNIDEILEKLYQIDEEAEKNETKKTYEKIKFSMWENISFLLIKKAEIYYYKGEKNKALETLNKARKEVRKKLPEGGVRSEIEEMIEDYTYLVKGEKKEKQKEDPEMVIELFDNKE